MSTCGSRKALGPQRQALTSSRWSSSGTPRASAKASRYSSESSSSTNARQPASSDSRSDGSGPPAARGSEAGSPSPSRRRDYHPPEAGGREGVAESPAASAVSASGRTPSGVAGRRAGPRAGPRVECGHAARPAVEQLVVADSAQMRAGTPVTTVRSGTSLAHHRRRAHHRLGPDLDGGEDDRVRADPACAPERMPPVGTSGSLRPIVGSPMKVTLGLTSTSSSITVPGPPACSSESGARPDDDAVCTDVPRPIMASSPIRDPSRIARDLLRYAPGSIRAPATTTLLLPPAAVADHGRLSERVDGRAAQRVDLLRAAEDRALLERQVPPDIHVRVDRHVRRDLARRRAARLRARRTARATVGRDKLLAHERAPQSVRGPSRAPDRRGRVSSRAVPRLLQPLLCLRGARLGRASPSSTARASANRRGLRSRRDPRELREHIQRGRARAGGRRGARRRSRSRDGERHGECGRARGSAMPMSG